MKVKPFFAHYADGGWAFELRYEIGKGYYLDVPAEGEYLYLSRQEAAARVVDYLFNLMSVDHGTSVNVVEELGNVLASSVGGADNWRAFSTLMQGYPGFKNLLWAVGISI